MAARCIGKRACSIYTIKAGILLGENYVFFKFRAEEPYYEFHFTLFLKLETKGLLGKAAIFRQPR